MQDFELILLPLFFLVALLYSSVGLGGGSSYTALMAILGVSHGLIPATSLSLNVAVTSIGVANFGRAGHIRPEVIGPFLVASMPMAFLGGRLELSAQVFQWLLLLSLVFVAARIYLVGDLRVRLHPGRAARAALSLLLGAVLGFVAGTVGIGGGIYLVPLLILLDLASEKEAAAAGTVFVFLNSLAGLASRFQAGTLEARWILPPLAAVLAGGFIGSHLGSSRFAPRTVQRALGVVILIAIVFLARRLWS